MGAAAMAPVKGLGASIGAAVDAKANGAGFGKMVGAGFKGGLLSHVSSIDKMVDKGTGVVNETAGTKFENKAWGSDSFDKMHGKVYSGISGLYKARAALARNGSTEQ